MISALAFFAAMSLRSQAAPVTADQVTYGQLTRCAAVFQLSTALADPADPIRESGVSATAAYLALAGLHGEGLGRDAARVERDVADEFEELVELRAMAEPRLFERSLQTDQQVCVIVSQRILRESKGSAD